MTTYIPSLFKKLVEFNVNDYERTFENIVQKYVQ